MHTLVAVENVTLDGVAQSPGRPDEDTRGGFALGGWAGRMLAADPEAASRAMAGREETAALLFGHRTYDDLVGYWLSSETPNPFAEVLTRTPKYVVSRDPSTVLPFPASTLLVGEAVETVRELKDGGEGPLVVLGSTALVRDLTRAGLVDQFVLTTLPVVLGSGARLFEGTPVSLEVESSWTSRTGIVVASYRVRREDEPAGA